MFGCIKSSERASNELFLCAAPCQIRSGGDIRTPFALSKSVLVARTRVRNSTVTKARSPYLHDAALDPSGTGEELCQDATEEILFRVEIGRR
jgi:hypothetical protein